MSVGSSGLTEAERAELEQLRAEKAEREELEQLRAEKLEHERARRRAQEADAARRHDLRDAQRVMEARERGRKIMEPGDDLAMPIGQKVVLVGIAVVVIAVIVMFVFGPK